MARALFLLTFLAISSLGASNNSTPHLLTVTGEGEISLQADIADIQVAVDIRHANAADAEEALAAKTKPILEKLRALKAEKPETGPMQILPEYDKDSPRRITAYKGRVSLRFSTPAAEAGSLIAAAIEAGANELTGLSLRPADSVLKEGRLKALRGACFDAMEKAQVILDALKLDNLGIVQVSTDSYFPGPVSRAYELNALAKAAPPLEVTGQEQTIKAHVQVQVEISNR